MSQRIKLPKEKFKKEDLNIPGLFFSGAFMVWNIIWITIWHHEGFTFDWVGAIIISVITGTFGCLFVLAASDRQYIKPLHFIIFEFEIWNKEKSEYVKVYDYGRTNLYAGYFLQYQTSLYTNSTTIEDIENRANSRSYIPLSSTEAVMRAILREVKDLMKTEMEKQNVTVRNISTLETISIEGLIKMVKEEKK
jgi:virulence-associated protein VapD